MKAKMEANCVERESRRAVAVLLDGRVSKKTSRKCNGLHDKSGEENTEEMKEYLGKLKELVPFMPKNRKLSKLEVISHVIDYIHDLRETLGLPPCQQNDMDYLEEDSATVPNLDMSTPLVTNQTFKVALVNASSVSNSESRCDIHARVPLSSISAPRNTDVDDSSSSNSSSANIS